MGNPWLAVPRGTEPGPLSRTLRVAHERFVTTGDGSAAVRPLVLDSWKRCAGSGVDPDHVLPRTDLLDGDLDEYRRSHPLARVMPVLRRLLVSDAVDGSFVVAVTDADGRILWLEGDTALVRRAESMAFMPGAVWSEDVAGTNAPGTSLALDHPVQVFASEHFCRTVQPWSCSAAPVHDPATGALLGAIDVTGGDAIAAPQVLTMVRAAVAAVESELDLRRPAPAERPPRPVRRPAPDADATIGAGTVRLRVLGRPAAVLDRGGRTSRLSLRHSELLLLLAANPVGLTAEQLSVELHDQETAAVTTRAEMSRLRQLVGQGLFTSRPYRLVEALRTDVAEVRDRLDAGAYRDAFDRYEGPVLPRSDAPGVVALREQLREHLRAALLAGADADLLFRYATSPDGRDDVEVWLACLDRLPAGSPRTAQVRGHLRWLDARLAATFAQRRRT